MEFAGGFGHDESVAHGRRFAQIAGHKARVFHRQHQLVLQRLTGRGNDGIGTADQAAADLHLQGDILPRAEEGEFLGVHPFEGQLPDGIGEGTRGGQFHLHIAGMELFRQGVGAVLLGQGFVLPFRQHPAAGGDHLFEPQHVHKAKGLFFEIHSPCASFFKSPTVCRPERSPEM